MKVGDRVRVKAEASFTFGKNVGTVFRIEDCGRYGTNVYVDLDARRYMLFLKFPAIRVPFELNDLEVITK